MIVRAARPEEYEEVTDLVHKAFQAEIERTMIRVTTSKDTNFKKGDLRVGEIDGKIVSMMMLIRKQLRIGAASVNGTIVAPVATHPDYERKGYCSAVRRDAILYMRTQNSDITILWGIPWLYQRYGYSPAMMKTELAIRPNEYHTSEKHSCRFAPFTEAHLESVTHIYQNNTALRHLSERRSPVMWEWKPGGPKVKFEVVLNKRDKTIGYLVLGTDWDGRPVAHEIGVMNDEACKVILNRLIETCRKKDLKAFYCVIHPEHPFARYAFWQNGEIRINRGWTASGRYFTGMAMILDLSSLLGKMKKEFEHRLCHSEFNRQKCTLTISTDEESVTLHLNHGQVAISTDYASENYQLKTPLEHLNPLITGYKGIMELLKNPQVKINGGKLAVRLIEVLFPVNSPFGSWLPLFWE